MARGVGMLLTRSFSPSAGETGDADGTVSSVDGSTGAGGGEGVGAGGDGAGGWDGAGDGDGTGGGDGASDGEGAGRGDSGRGVCVAISIGPGLSWSQYDVA